MMNKYKSVFALMSFVIVLSAAHAQTLRSLATARGFTIGAGATDPSPDELGDSTYASVTAAQFNSIEPANVAKMYVMEPSNGTYTFTQLDQVYTFAQANAQTVTVTSPVWDGHPGGSPASYCGNCGNPSWLSSGGYNASQMTTILQNYVTALVTHLHNSWPGVTKQIALVGESAHLCPNGSYDPGYGTGTMCGTIGPDTSSGAYAAHVSGLTYFPKYVTIAYTAARAADPTAKLCYEDWGGEGAGIGTATYDYWQVAYLKSLGLVDCVALEGQWQYAALPGYVPSISSIQSNLASLAGLGVTTYFSQVELGIANNSPAGNSVSYPNNYIWNNSGDLTTQATTYSQLITACLNAPSNSCNGFYPWGTTDKWAFLDSPSGGVGNPQLYDPSYNPKPAYTSIKNALASGSPTYTLSTATAGTGSGTVTGCAGSYSAGAPYSCTVTPAGGSTLSGVTGCGGSGSTTYSGSMPSSSCTVTATFSSSGCTGSVTVSVASGPSAVLAAANTLSCATSVLHLTGSASWSGGFIYTVPSSITNFTVQGSTTVNCTGNAGTSTFFCSASDSTIIQDIYQTNTPLMKFNLGGSSTYFTMTGLTVEGGVIGGSYTKYDGMVQIASGNSQNVRIYGNHFNANTYSPANFPVMVRVFAPVAGVMDHNLMELGPDTQYSFGLSIFGAYQDTNGNGDTTWNNPTPWGQFNGVFSLETNYITGGVSNDCGNAGFMLIRYNYMNDNTTAVQTHGTKSPAGPERGCRGIDVNHNYITHPTGSPGDGAVGSKAGPAMVWDNIMPQGFYRFFTPSTDRSGGDSAPETNTPNGWGYCSTTTTNPSTGNPNGVGSAWDGNQPNIAGGYPCLDNLGRGQTTQALNGQAFPNRLNTASGTIAWPRQYLEPIYLFGNTISPQSGVSVNIRDITSQPNRDVFADCNGQTQTWSGGSTSCSSFNGTVGTGTGPLASIPVSCTPGAGGTYATSPTGSYGVGYFATDANGGVGELYICTANGTWTPVYHPPQYPHPLVTGQAATPVPSKTPGSYPSPVSLTFSSATPGSSLFCTTDGSTPTPSSTPYSPFTLTVTTTVQCVATASGYSTSAVGGGTYITGSSITITGVPSVTGQTNITGGP